MTTSGTKEEEDNNDLAKAGLVEHKARAAEARERVDTDKGNQHKQRQ